MPMLLIAYIAPCDLLATQAEQIIRNEKYPDSVRLPTTEYGIFRQGTT